MISIWLEDQEGIQGLWGSSFGAGAVAFAEQLSFWKTLSHTTLVLFSSDSIAFSSGNNFCVSG